jgi:hypothetical protein
MESTCLLTNLYISGYGVRASVILRNVGGNGERYFEIGLRRLDIRPAGRGLRIRSRRED